MKQFLFIICLLFLNNLFAQEIFFEQKMDLKETKVDFLPELEREAYTILHQDNSGFTQCILDKKYIRALKFDGNYKVINELKVNRPTSNFIHLLGHDSLGGKYHLFFMNKKQNKFLVQEMGEGKEGVELSLKLEDELFVNAFDINDEFYLLTCLRNSSILKLYKYDGSELIMLTDFDLSEYDFYDDGRGNLYYAILRTGKNITESERTTKADKGKGIIGLAKGEIDVRKINNSTPNPFNTLAGISKLYIQDKKIIITVDNEIFNTKVVSLDIEKQEAKVDIYNHTKTICSPPKNNGLNKKTILRGSKTFSNSYVYQNKLYQVISCPKEMVFSITELETRENIQTFKVLGNDVRILFGNTPFRTITLEKSLLKNYIQEHESPSFFLSTVAKNFLALYAYEYNEETVVAIGCSEGCVQNFTMENPKGIGHTGTTTSNASFMKQKTNTTTYANNAVTYFKSLLSSETLEHQEGEIEETAFDKMQALYLKAVKKDIYLVAETFFKFKDRFVFGYYHIGQKKYYLRTLSDGNDEN